MTKLAGWGRFRPVETQLRRVRHAADVAAALAEGPLIARGNGRAYGDSAVNAGLTLDMRGMDRMLSFDAEAGTLLAEAGVLLADIVEAFLPRGWFLSVTPGTKFVTLGGAIAADVHGKNHHVDGSFGSTVDWIDLMGPDGTVTRCSRDAEPELFQWTLGGMGLTGVILRAQIRLRPVETAWIVQDMRPAPDLDAAMEVFETTTDVPYSVAWIDCAHGGEKLGRSLVMLGRHATLEDLPAEHRAAPFEIKRKRSLRIPIDLPGFALNRYTVRAFNTAYYWAGSRKAGETLVDWDSYFYPLDSILDWNRIYGRRGFLQFQCGLPEESAKAGLTALLRCIADSGHASFLSVLKRFGPQEDPIAFPMAGYTLALDFPADQRTLALMETLDALTLDHGGRFYLAKDARLPRSVLDAADQRAERFRAMRADRGLAAAFASRQSERLGL